MAPGPRPRPLCPGGSSVRPPAAAGREVCGRATAVVPRVQRRGGRAGGSPARGRPSPSGDAPLGDLGAAGPGARSLQQADLQPPEPAGPHPDRGHARLTWPAAAAGAGPGAAPAAAKPGREGGARGGGARAWSKRAGGREALFPLRGTADPASPWQPLGAVGPVGTPGHTGSGTRRAAPAAGTPALVLSSPGALRGQAPSRATIATNTPLSQSRSPNHLSRPSKKERGTREERPKANSYFHPGRHPLPLAVSHGTFRKPPSAPFFYATEPLKWKFTEERRKRSAN